MSEPHFTPSLNAVRLLCNQFRALMDLSNLLGDAERAVGVIEKYEREKDSWQTEIAALEAGFASKREAMTRDLVEFKAKCDEKKDLMKSDLEALSVDIQSRYQRLNAHKDSIEVDTKKADEDHAARLAELASLTAAAETKLATLREEIALLLNRLGA